MIYKCAIFILIVSICLQENLFTEIESEEREPTPPVKREPTPIPPQFTESLDDTSPSEGDELTLRCTVKGLPDPTVEWLIDGEVQFNYLLGAELFVNAFKFRKGDHLEARKSPKDRKI